MPIHRYIAWNVDQPMLLPVDLREWLRPDHEAYLVLAVLDQLDLSAFYRGRADFASGRPGYHPKMMLALLVYGYLNGVRSSRRIERLCEDSVAFRVLAAGHRPDHATIARFRDEHLAELKELFVQVLRLARAAGLGDFSIVAGDGSKVEANASLKAQRSLPAIDAEIAELTAAVEAMLGEAVATDAQPALPDLDAPAQGRTGVLADRLTRLRAARTRLLAEDAERGGSRDQRRVIWAQRRVEKVKEKIQLRTEKEAAAAAAGRRLNGSVPDLADELAHAEAALAHALTAVSAATDPAASPPATKGKRKGRRRRRPPGDDHKPTANVTDPDAKLMRHPRRGWHASFNAQAAVTKDGLVIATGLSADTTDYAAAQPLMRDAQTAATIFDTTIGVMLFDAGYSSDDNITAAGPNRLIADTKTHKLRRRPSNPTPDPPADATPRQKMTHRLRTERGKALYAHRQHLIEPVFGDHKYNRGFWKLLLRGNPAAAAEWSLMNTVRNLRAIFKHGDLAAAGLARA